MTYEHLFPTRDDIPAEHRVDPHAADAYLVDGELRQWAGPTETACGPVFVRTGGGLERPPIGHYPLHDEATALEALCDAFPRGVVNTVSGTGRAVAPPTMASGGVDVLAFIGSAPAADGIELERPGHSAAGIAIFACPPECRNCHGPHRTVQVREDAIVTSRAR
jgi:hypothetical protein